MKVIRKQKINTEMFELGDEIKFKLTNGEKVRAKAVQECDEGMLFITKDCIGKEMPMYNGAPKWHLDYAHSDLRKYLNCELLSLFPKKIRNRMCPMIVEDSYRDYLRIPTEKEIFGENIHGIEESNTNQFHGMNHLRNRIAFRHTNEGDEWEWYWLQNRNYVASFVSIGDGGCVFCSEASESLGVRVVFMLKQNYQ